MLACSGQAEHAHEEGERHGHSLSDRAGRVFGSASLPEGPMARFVAGDEEALDASQKAGLEAFLQAGCAHCHAGPQLGGSEEAPALTGPLRPDLEAWLLEHGEADEAQRAAIPAFLALF